MRVAHSFSPLPCGKGRRDGAEVQPQRPIGPKSLLEWSVTMSQVLKVEGDKSYQDAMARIATLEAQLAAKSNGKLTLKISVDRTDKAGKAVDGTGALILYGLGRFPVTLYASQWERLIAFIPEVKAFIDANRDKMTVRT